MLLTAVGPALWGTNYLTTTELLPPGRPLLAGAIRALPAGLLLLTFVGLRYGRLGLPRGSWWWRAAALGGLNIGLFFALFFIAAYRLPGGVAAVLGAIGPFLVAGLAYPLLGERPPRKAMIAAAFGVAGVGLLVLRSTASLDAIGLAAAAVGVITVSLATVLGRRWGVPAAPSAFAGVLALTAWQLVAGGLLLLPAALLVEGPPPALDGSALLGFGYLTLIGTALAHFLWFQGVSELAPTRVTMLALLSPVVATIMGWIALGQSLSAGNLPARRWCWARSCLVLPGRSRQLEIKPVRPPATWRSRWIGIESTCTVLPRRLDTGVGNPAAHDQESSRRSGGMADALARGASALSGRGGSSPPPTRTIPQLRPAQTPARSSRRRWSWIHCQGHGATDASRPPRRVHRPVRAWSTCVSRSR